VSSSLLWAQVLTINTEKVNVDEKIRTVCKSMIYDDVKWIVLFVAVIFFFFLEQYEVKDFPKAKNEEVESYAELLCIFITFIVVYLTSY
jgi:hypothetical protein